jgi:hypothetical protein
MTHAVGIQLPDEITAYRVGCSHDNQPISIVPLFKRKTEEIENGYPFILFLSGEKMEKPPKNKRK